MKLFFDVSLPQAWAFCTWLLPPGVPSLAVEACAGAGPESCCSAAAMEDAEVQALPKSCPARSQG